MTTLHAERPGLVDFKDKPFLREAPLNLFEIRLRHGMDLFLLFEVDHAKERLRLIKENTFKGANPREKGRIQSISKAVKTVGLGDWYGLYNRTRSRFDLTVPFDRDDLNRWLSGRLGGEDGPHSAGVGWLSEIDDLPGIFYFAAWMTDGYQLVYPLTFAVRRLYNALKERGASDPRNIVIDQPIEQGNGGVVKQLVWDGRTYPLRTDLRWFFDPVAKQLDIEGFSPGFVGGEAELQQAWEGILGRIDYHFQSLINTRTIDRDDDQDRRWRLLRRLIDVDAYLDQKPMRMRKIGRIARKKPGEVIVAWVDEREAETVPLDGRMHVAQEFDKLPVGAWFEAEVFCHPRNQELRSIESFRRDDSLNVTTEQALEFWDKIAEDWKRADSRESEDFSS